MDESGNSGDILGRKRVEPFAAFIPVLGLYHVVLDAESL
jgi:hypothetical protein